MIRNQVFQQTSQVVMFFLNVVSTLASPVFSKISAASAALSACVKKIRSDGVITSACFVVGSCLHAVRVQVFTVLLAMCQCCIHTLYNYHSSITPTNTSTF